MPQEPQVEATKSIPFDIWETGGVTEHIGGIYATQRLVQMCEIVADQTMLDIGCGTGYTACHLAKEHHARVLALDINNRSVVEARRRVSRERMGDLVNIIRADAHHLPCRSNAFDAVLLESVAVFCDQPQVLSEVFRVLKPGGSFGDNEFTLLHPPPEDLQTLLQNTLGIRTHLEAEWRSLFNEAGFQDVISSIQRISLWEQLASHLRVDGFFGYMSAMRRGLANQKISRVFINRDMLKAARKFMPYVGYGLYSGKKGSDF